MLLFFTFAFAINLTAINLVWFLTKKFADAKEQEQLTLQELKDCFLDKSKNKLEYINLNNTNTNKKITKMFKKMKKPTFADHELMTNKNYLFTISKFIDYKINNSKQTFRAKSKKILIEEISYLLAKNLIITGECKVFSNFKKFQILFNLRQKELKVFKILFAKNLLQEIILIEDELYQISKVIQKSKNAKKLKSYKKNILNSANLYGTLKFNKNSSKFFEPKNTKYWVLTQNFFKELIESEHRIKLCLTYIKVLFV